MIEHRYRRVRQFTLSLCATLETEDYVVQTMPDVSPAKWHLAHTTWFFETFVLEPFVPGYESPNPQYAVLFNSYYQAVGEQWSRPHRGILSRPTVADIHAYREHVDGAMERALQDLPAVAREAVELGLHHEQQHQELLLTDIKHVFASNPLRPVFRRDAARPSGASARDVSWRSHAEGIREVGHGGEGFAYDNEGPRHRRLVLAFDVADRLVTAGEWLEFIADDGYRTPSLWLSAGWAAVCEQGWEAPLYWERRDGAWWEMTLGGMRPVDRAAPVTHVSFFEAEAFATWAGARLPDEAEWEVACGDSSPDGANFADAGNFHPVAASPQTDQFFGDVWEWTRSDYAPYPGYRPPEGALGEYNGKFMCGQYVLRGGSCATSADHMRPTYRNFFPPDARWQFSGVRLARDPA